MCLKTSSRFHHVPLVLSLQPHLKRSFLACLFALSLWPDPNAWKTQTNNSFQSVSTLFCSTFLTFSSFSRQKDASTPHQHHRWLLLRSQFFLRHIATLYYFATRRVTTRRSKKSMHEKSRTWGLSLLRLTVRNTILKVKFTPLLPQAFANVSKCTFRVRLRTFA